MHRSIERAVAANTRQTTLIREAGLVLAGSALVALAAKTQIPLSPVPMTGQDFAVLLLGATLGARRGALALIAYLLEGLIGLPVFAGPSAGFTYFAGPTAGYLLAFPMAAWVMGRFAESGWTRRVWTCVCAAAACNAIVLAMGFTWASAFLGVRGALAAGLVPFLPWNAVKIAALTMLLVGLGQRGRANRA